MVAFWEHGFGDTSIDALTLATGVQRSSLYNTFQSKRELYLSSLRRYHGRMSERFALIASSSDPIAAVRSFVCSVVTEEAEDGVGFGCMIANAALEFGGRDDEVRDLTNYNLTVLADAIAAAVRRGQTLGDVDAAVDPKTFAQTVVVLIQGLRVTARAIVPEDREPWLRAAVDSGLAALAPRKTSPTMNIHLPAVDTRSEDE